MHEQYLSFLKHEVRLAWLTEGDENSAMFHRATKQGRLQNTIMVFMMCVSGNWKEDEMLEVTFIDYYKQWLGTTREHIFQDIIAQGKFLTEDHQN